MPFGANAQRDSVAAAPQKIRGVQYSPDNVASAQQKELPFLAGFSVSGNLAGAFLSLVVHSVPSSTSTASSGAK